MLDTCIIVSAFRSSRGASRRVLELVGHGMVVPLVSLALFLEYEEVLKRADQLAVSGLSVDQIDGALAAFASAAEAVELHFTWRPQLADSDDEMVLDAAVNGRADAIITHNAADFAAASRFSMPVIGPRAMLERMRG